MCIAFTRFLSLLEVVLKTLRGKTITDISLNLKLIKRNYPQGPLKKYVRPKYSEFDPLFALKQ